MKNFAAVDRSMSSIKTESPRKTPDTLVIVFFVALFAAALSWLIPAGSFQTQNINYLSGDIEK